MEMNTEFLLKLMADLLDKDKPSTEEINCVKKILENLIGFYDKVNEPEEYFTPPDPNLDDEARQAKQELLNG